MVNVAKPSGDYTENIKISIPFMNDVESLIFEYLKINGKVLIETMCDDLKLSNNTVIETIDSLIKNFSVSILITEIKET